MNENKKVVTVTFDEASPRDVSLYIGELSKRLRSEIDDEALEIHRQRPDVHAQDFGNMLVLVLGTQTTVTVIKILGEWLKMRYGVGIDIEIEGVGIFKNVKSKDIAELIDKIQKPKEKQS